MAADPHREGNLVSNVPKANPAETKAELNAEKRRKSRIHAINLNSDYDAIATAIKVLRELRDGKHGRVTDICIISRTLRSVEGERAPHYDYSFHGGSDGRTRRLMLESVLETRGVI